jgi:hypothetical protein
MPFSLAIFTIPNNKKSPLRASALQKKFAALIFLRPAAFARAFGQSPTRNRAEQFQRNEFAEIAIFI